MDPYGLHKLDCEKFTLAKKARHDAINDVLSRGLRQAQVANRVEPHGLHVDDNICPDGVTLLPWSNGRCLTWDVTVHNTYAQSYLPQASRQVGAVARRAEGEKRRLYQPLMDRFMFVPFVLETSGVWGEEAREFVKQIGRRITQVTGEQRATSFLYQRISIEATRGTSIILLEGLPSGDHLDELFEL